MTQEKEYFAFISYQRKDEEWADRLRNKLEHYRLPSSVRKQDASLPKEIRPIFRDALELAGGVLAKEIETALQNSKYLIVICSPNSAKSPWVNKEIQTFIDLSREDRIIPFIIDGTPFSDNADTECFPPALRSLKGEKELLGININELSRDAASIKVVARMFGLKFDTLWQRYEREQRRKIWMVIGGVLIFALISLGVGGYIAWQNRELDAKNQEITAERDRANKEKDRANSERDKAEATNASLRQANDSIERQYALIEQQKDEIAKERDNVKNANYAMKVNLSRILAKEASKLVDEGDSYLARLIALESLPPNLPFTVESEVALRTACSSEKALLRGHTDGIHSIAFSLDGKKIVTGSSDNTIKIWDVKTGVCLKTLDGHTGSVRFVDFSPNNLMIVSTSRDETVRLWNLETGDYKCIGDNCCYWTGARFYHDGRDIVYAEEDSICIYNIKSGRINKYHHRSSAFALSSDGKFIATIRNGTINNISICDIIDYHTGDVVKSFSWCDSIKESWRIAQDITFSHDNSRVIITHNELLLITDVKTGGTQRLLMDNEDIIGGVALTPDDRYILLTVKNKTQMLDMESGKIVTTFSQESDGGDIAISSDGKRVAYSSHLTSGNVTYITRLSYLDVFYTGKSLYSAVCSPNEQYIVSASYDGTIDLWDYNKKKLVKNIGAHDAEATSVSFSSDGMKILTSSLDNTVCIWDVETAQCISRYSGHTGGVWSAEFSPDQQYVASASIDSTIRIWDVSNTKCVMILKGHKGTVLKATYSPDGRYIASASLDKTIRLWNTRTGVCVKVLQGHSSAVSCVAFSPNGKLVLSSSDDQSIRLWDVSTGDCLKIYKGHTSIVSCVAFSPDGRYIVSSSTNADNTVRIWDVATGMCLRIYKDHKDRVHTASFFHDGKNLISASTDGTIRIWGFPPLQDLIDQTRERFKNRQLTPEERRKYYLE